jgi:hypothetical protein
MFNCHKLTQNIKSAQASALRYRWLFLCPAVSFYGGYAWGTSVRATTASSSFSTCECSHPPLFAVRSGVDYEVFGGRDLALVRSSAARAALDFGPYPKPKPYTPAIPNPSTR